MPLFWRNYNKLLLIWQKECCFWQKSKPLLWETLTRIRLLSSISQTPSIILNWKKSVVFRIQNLLNWVIFQAFKHHLPLSSEISPKFHSKNLLNRKDKFLIRRILITIRLSKRKNFYNRMKERKTLSKINK